MNVRAALVVSVLLIGSWLVYEPTGSGGEAQLPPQSDRELLIRDGVRLDELEHDVRSLEAWKESHAKSDNLFTERFAAEHRELQVRVDALERVLWLLAGAVVAIGVEIVWRLLGRRKKEATA